MRRLWAQLTRKTYEKLLWFEQLQLLIMCRFLTFRLHSNEHLVGCIVKRRLAAQTSSTQNVTARHCTAQSVEKIVVGSWWAKPALQPQSKSRWSSFDMAWTRDFRENHVQLNRGLHRCDEVWLCCELIKICYHGYYWCYMFWQLEMDNVTDPKSWNCRKSSRGHVWGKSSNGDDT